MSSCSNKAKSLIKFNSEVTRIISKYVYDTFIITLLIIGFFILIKELSYPLTALDNSFQGNPLYEKVAAKVYYVSEQAMSGFMKLFFPTIDKALREEIKLINNYKLSHNTYDTDEGNIYSRYKL